MTLGILPKEYVAILLENPKLVVLPVGAPPMRILHISRYRWLIDVVGLGPV